MIRLHLSELTQHMDAVLIGKDLEFCGCSTDSRSIGYEQLFIALSGDNFDGHEFVSHAIERGAAAIMTERKLAVKIPQLLVPDTRKAMGELAALWRSRFNIPLVAVTGSNGKTTVKEMLAAIFATQGKVLATHGNLNNDIGVPLTLFNLSSNHQYAVIEMGANHTAEIAWLSQIASPYIGVITQCAPAHLEGFGSIQNVAMAKGEIFLGLQREGIAVINADDDFAGLWEEMADGRQVLHFGLQSNAEVRAEILAPKPDDDSNRFRLICGEQSIEVRLALLGRHNVMNALAASACAIGLQIPLEHIRDGLEAMKPVCGRLQKRPGTHNSLLLDDSYNANPVSLKSALDVLVEFPGRHWLVLGDMGELGEQAEEYHRLAGKMAREKNIDRLYTLGELSQGAHRAFGENAHHYAEADSLIASLNEELAEDVTVLIKGSRAMHLEHVVSSLMVRKN